MALSRPLFSKRLSGGRSGRGGDAVILAVPRRLHALILLLALVLQGAAAASPKRVLILNPFGRDVEPFSAAVSSFRSTLARDLGELATRLGC